MIQDAHLLTDSWKEWHINRGTIYDLFDLNLEIFFIIYGVLLQTIKTRNRGVKIIGKLKLSMNKFYQNWSLKHIRFV
jgi:hypothetical protein